MKTAAIHQPQYLPYLGFFNKLQACDVFIVLDSVQFQKNGLQNRNKIKTSQGWQWLTVPVLHKSGQLINEVRIKHQSNWRKKHWAALVSNYSSAPFFGRYEEDLQALLREDWDSLLSVNMAFQNWVADQLSIETRVVQASSLPVTGRRTELLVRLCQSVGADQYFSGPGGKRYMDLSVFENAGIDVLWQDFEGKEYRQLFSEVPFTPNLSVIDALLNCGSEVSEMIREVDQP